MPLNNGKWTVVKGDCLWNIAVTVYKNGYRWKEIANANGISQSSPIIFPNQVLVIPGVTSGVASSGESYTPTSMESPVNGVRLDWFCLSAGTERDMEARWSWTRGDQKFWVKWEEYDLNNNKWVIAENKCYETTTGETPQSKQSASENATKVRISIRPVKDSEGNFQDNTAWTCAEYDFSNNPPKLPPTPTISLDMYNTLNIRIDEIDEDINGDSIEIVIYQNDTTRYKTATVPIDLETGFAVYNCTVPAGYKYKVRCRAKRGSIYGAYTGFTENVVSRPNSPEEITTLRPQIIKEQTNKQYGIFVEWPEISTAKYYQVEWTTNVEYFDISDNVSSQNTEEGKGPRLLVTNIELGHEYFFRVRSVNDAGNSQYWSAIKSVIIGSKPSAPTTWSNTTSLIMGEDLNLYWNFNSTDGSIETYAKLYIKLIDPTDPDNPEEYTKTIPNDRPDDEKENTSVYTINSDDEEWSMLDDGFTIKWKVQTAGITDEYSEWSIEREVNVYTTPELELDVKNQNGESVDEINTYPFTISALATPTTQNPISYYLEIVSNNYYESVDDTNVPIIVNPGDKVYQKFYDPDEDLWNLVIEMTPANVSLKNNINYTINCTVSMDSGLTAIGTKDFKVYFDDLFYDVYADITINKETLEATIHPYCTEYYAHHYEDELIDGDNTNLIDGDGAQLLINDDSTFTDVRLFENCKLSVYRREYDGTYTEIETEIPNQESTYVTDPHPSLDYARYRVISKSDTTGSISYSDVPAVKVNEPSIIIQWAEDWSNFESGDNGEGSIEPAWTGSMIKLPYNIKMSESNNTDVSLVEYVGRKRPVSYYGTQIGETATWSIDIPKDDKETLYALRRLKIWTGDVYVREPSGTGYWANISVSYNIDYSSLIIPVTFNIKRVEGGI